MNILLVEDDKRISSFITKGLKEMDYNVYHAESSKEALILMDENNIEIMVFDIMLPDIDGFELTKMVRLKGNNTPILILSALGEASDKVTALDNGADDYLTKPFHFNEFISRINALARRHNKNYQNNNTSNILNCSDLIIDIEKHIELKLLYNKTREHMYGKKY